MRGIHIEGTGRALPKRVVTNDDLSNIVDTSDEWIVTRTGIKQRYYCDGELNWQLAARAAGIAIEDAGIEKQSIDLVVVATFTPDYAAPSVACMIQKELGLREDIMAFDINAACSGFMYGLEVANSLLEGRTGYALVIGSEQISTRMDMTDRATCVLFGDGAGAAVVRKSDDNWYSIMGAKGDETALGCRGITFEDSHIYMDGKAVFKFAVTAIPKALDALLEKAGITVDDVDHILCHQANERIIKSVALKYKTAKDKFYVNIDRYGNTSAASIAIALDEMRKTGVLHEGERIILVGFGAGFTWGAILLQM